MDFIKILKAIAEPTRLKILRILATRDMYVCELEYVLDMSQPRISAHLRTLREAELVTDEKNGRKNLVSLNNDTFFGCLDQLAEFMQTDIDSLTPYSNEVQRIKALDADPNVLACRCSD